MKPEKSETKESLARPLLNSFDQEFPPGERLPRKMEVLIVQEYLDDTATARTYVNGAPMGNPLNDNSYVDDGYRFHDIFHLGYAAVLGWSPVLRSLMNLRRKSNPEVLTREDGRNAQMIEEAIAALVFSQAEGHNFWEGAAAIGGDLLVQITRMTRRLEVAQRPPSKWEEAIFLGFESWRKIRKMGGGALIVDLDRRTMQVQK